MPTSALEADYLIVGAGAMGMAFADTLHTETDARMIVVDRYHQPGGHWNVAYPYVRLHQPSAFYGVNSRALGDDTIDQTGWNKGLYELATNSEVCAYFDTVMQRQLLASGRVQYFPMCNYTGERRFNSLLADTEYTVSAATVVVDATYMNVTVPSMRPPAYQVDAGVHCVAPNKLPRLPTQPGHYVVVGAGKTGMDACLFLLRNQVDPGAISWIMPRDSWLLDRANIQPAGAHYGAGLAGMVDATAAMADARSIADLFARLEDCGQLLRLDPQVEPSMYRCATVTREELEQLRRIEHVVRLGRVQRISPQQVELSSGTLAVAADTVFVDCTADGLERRPAVPVFGNDGITLQSVRTCQQVFSAAFIAHVAAAYDDMTLRNELCQPVPHPDSALDWLHTSLANSLNAARWAQDKPLSEWLGQARLDGFSSAAQAQGTPQAAQMLANLTQRSAVALTNLRALLDH